MPTLGQSRQTGLVAETRVSAPSPERAAILKDLLSLFGSFAVRAKNERASFK